MFLLMNYIAIHAQHFSESFTISVATDQCCVLKFYNSIKYEYYSHNLIGGSNKTLESGTYQKVKNKIVLTNKEKHKNMLPKVLYYSRMSKKAFDNLDFKPFAHKIKNYILWKRVHVLSKAP